MGRARKAAAAAVCFIDLPTNLMYKVTFINHNYRLAPTLVFTNIHKPQL
jgi:hypothetical protein